MSDASVTGAPSVVLDGSIRVVVVLSFVTVVLEEASETPSADLDGSIRVVETLSFVMVVLEEASEAPSVVLDGSIRVVEACSLQSDENHAELSALADGTAIVNKLRIPKVIMVWSFIVSFLEGTCICCDRGAQSKLLSLSILRAFFRKKRPCRKSSGVARPFNPEKFR